MQKESEIQLNEESDVITRDINAKVIGRLSQKSQQLIQYNELLDGISDPQSPNSTWLNVKTLPSDETNKYMLVEGDIIKLGRVKFLVKEIKIHDYETTFNLNGAIETFPLRSIIKSNERQNLVIERNLPADQDIQDVTENEGKTLIKCMRACRFCLMDFFTMDDPLVRACKCSGSLEFLHINCLRQWIQTKLNMK